MRARGPSSDHLSTHHRQWQREEDHEVVTRSSSGPVSDSASSRYARLVELRHRVHRRGPRQRVEPALHRPEGELDADAEHGDEHRPAVQHGVVLEREAVDDVAAQTTAGDERGEGRGRHRLDRRGAQAGEDQGARQGQLDAPKLLAARHAHAAGGVLDVRVDLPQSDVGVGEDRGDREQGKGEDGRKVTDADRFPRREDDQDAEGRDRPAGVADVHREEAAPRPRWPSQIPSGSATAQASSRASPEITRCWASRVGMPSGPCQCAGSVSHCQVPLTRASPPATSTASAAAAAPRGAARRPPRGRCRRAPRS